MALLGIWLLGLLALASWYQSKYIHSFTQQSPNFLNAKFTESWFQALLPHLPLSHTKVRVVQFWNPDCLCNRFASRHAINTINYTKANDISHITIIPQSTSYDEAELQRLNPDTKIYSLDANTMPNWPSSPSIIIQGALSTPIYFGPLGYGAFCSQSSSNAIEQQLNAAKYGPVKTLL